MCIGKNIKRLRREKNWTQEELADSLSVSPQAVSRWEKDAAMPDITFLPVLCGLFGVTSDELLGIDNEKRREEIDAIIQKTAVLDPPSAKLPILEDALRRYPDSFDLMSELMYVYYGEDRSEDALRLGEKILEKCTDDATRHCAVQVLCLTYAEQGRTEEAERLAEQMPNVVCSRDFLLHSIASGDKRYRTGQKKIDELTVYLRNAVDGLNAPLDSGERPYTPEERVELDRKQIALFKILCENGDYGEHGRVVALTYFNLACRLAQLGNTEEALVQLNCGADCLLGFIEYTRHPAPHTSLLLRGRLHPWMAERYRDYTSDEFLGYMATDSDLDPLRDTPEFAAILDKLRAVGV